MASVVGVSEIGVDGLFVAKWLTMGIADQGTMVRVPYGFEPKAVQVVGTLGGATVTLEGSVDGVTLVGVEDVDSAAVALTVAGMVGLGIDVPYFAPKTAGGTGSDVDVYLFARRAG
jgi:hypothetical protein